MVSNVRAFPSQMTVMSPQPSQQDWVWDGANWCSPCGGFPAPTPPPCPPPGFPTPCPPWFPPPAGQAPWYPGANGGVSFSATAPVNPIRGNFWWNGTTLQMFDGAAWVNIGGSGAIAGATKEVFSIGNPSNLTIATTGWSIVPFTTTPTIDTQGGWNAATQQYTPKTPGYYVFFVQTFGATSGAGDWGAALLKNDPGTFTNTISTNAVAISLQSVAVTSQSWSTTGGIALMNGVTDYVRLYGIASSGIYYGIGAFPSVQGYLLP